MKAEPKARFDLKPNLPRRERMTTPGFTGVSEALSRLLVTSPPAQAARNSTHSRVRMAVLSGVAGFVDAAGFATLAGLFPAHITGELVGAVAGVSSGTWQREAARVAVLIVFVTTVVLGALVSRAFRLRNQSPLAALFGLMTVGLVVASVSDWFFPGGASNAVSDSIKKCGLVAAMALQNVVMRHALSSSCPTTVMTGNLTQFIIEFVELLANRNSKERSERSVIRSKAETRLRVLGTALGAFLLCAALGVALTSGIGAVSVLLPATAVGVLAARELRHPTAISRTGTLY
ncbi:MAG: YoaK family protein [Polyangiaceae bacterium]